MEDMSAMISQILSDPNAVQQLQQAAAAMGLLGQQDSAPAEQQGDNGIYNQQRGRTHNQQGRSGSGQSRQGRQSGGMPVPQQAPVPARQVQQSASPSVPNVDLEALSRILGNLTGKPSPAVGSTPGPAGLTGLGGGNQQNSGGPDLSALAGLLGGGNQQNSGQQGGGGLDLSALSGLLGGGQQNSGGQQGGGGLDLSALSGLLSGGQQNSGSQQGGGGLDLSALSGLLGGGQQGGGPDLSALSGLLGGLGGNAEAPPSNSSVSALTSMLGGGNDSSGGMPGIDMSMIMKVQQAMSTMSANQENVRLLMALKSHLKSDRSKKVDDAVRVMQLIQFLPLLKESGLFGGIDSLLGNFGLNGVGDMLGDITSGKGIGGLLSGLNLSGGR